jgi:hypothetical protein
MNIKELGVDLIALISCANKTLPPVISETKTVLVFRLIIIIGGTTARIGPWPPLTGFRDGSVYTMWGYQPHDQPVLVILIRAPKTSVSKASRHIVAKQMKHR